MKVREKELVELALRGSKFMKKVFILFLTLILMSCSNLNHDNDVTLDNISITRDDMYASILLDDSDSVDLFLNSGFPIESPDEKGETLLTKAVKNNSLEVMKVLIERGANLDAPTYSYTRKNTDIKVPGKTPSYFVKSTDALKILIDSGANINYVDSSGEPLLIYFIKFKPKEYVRELLNNNVKVNTADSELWSPLIWAAVDGKSTTVLDLIASGADMNFRDARGNYAIYYAYNKEVISLLINENYDLNHKNSDGENVLGEVYLKCVANGYQDEVNRLIAIGVDPNYMSYGDSAISLAKENKDAKMIKLLEDQGAI